MTVATHPFLDALGVVGEDRTTKLVAVATAIVAESLDLELDEARVPVEEVAQGFLRAPTVRGGERVALARFAEALGDRLAETFGDVPEWRVRELADRRGSRLLEDRHGLRLLGLTAEGTRSAVYDDVAYLAVNVARRVCEDEPASPVPRPAGLEGWVS